ncbi:high affinity immunoglobulin gamma Fc receptor I-like [Xyrauchen texanus]|uniref:high affinity immunoglobulin gamma Fc receptor I-like n=1 Tax=Xyrauchen texanus TaxID=154827 RepID=UPI0022427C99|nr:high affinity immunoglobulin gamma Fc receptor I-like [Xyrauchen texanus]
MELIHYCLIALVALANAEFEEPTAARVLANITLSKGEIQVFTGEDLKITCSVPEDPSSSWRYKWFRDGAEIGLDGFREIRIEHSGEYSCQAEKDTEKRPFVLSTLPSLPLNLHVDRGWVLLQTPATPAIIDDTVILTCRIRNNPMAREVCFYKEASEIQCHNSKQLILTRATLEDGGIYWCRASWIQGNELHSAQSVPTPVTVLDKLNTPQLAIVSGRIVLGQEVHLRCNTQLNVKREDLHIEYYYMKNNSWLAPSSSSNTFIIRNVQHQDAGTYTCKAKVRILDVERLSDSLELKVR